jgi:hypothetical protein
MLVVPPDYLAHVPDICDVSSLARYPWGKTHLRIVEWQSEWSMSEPHALAAFTTAITDIWKDCVSDGNVFDGITIMGDATFFVRDPLNLVAADSLPDPLSAALHVQAVLNGM